MTHRCKELRSTTCVRLPGDRSNAFAIKNAVENGLHARGRHEDAVLSDSEHGGHHHPFLYTDLTSELWGNFLEHHIVCPKALPAQGTVYMERRTASVASRGQTKTHCSSDILLEVILA
jgi:hypothetical protein